jgi:hypothetical protein
LNCQYKYRGFALIPQGPTQQKLRIDIGVQLHLKNTRNIYFTTEEITLPQKKLLYHRRNYFTTEEITLLQKKLLYHRRNYFTTERNYFTTEETLFQFVVFFASQKCIQRLAKYVSNCIKWPLAPALFVPFVV